ncbi:RHS repeat-associated core domain-containing protein [Pseudomonas syringae]|nr:RHS repeat-associated core domain-containing protein [Pseudomonas syringae]
MRFQDCSGSYVEHAYNPIHRRYEYDPAGELSRTLDKLRGETQYEYEANGQLLARNTGRVVDGEEFRYDAAANRLNFNTSRFDHVKDNRLKQWANHEYKYDAWGNLIEKVVGIVRWQTFTYDCENRLVKTETMANTQVESTSSYQYDSLGRRVAKQSEIKGQTAHKRFLWQGLRMLREESPGQSSLYLYEPDSYAPLARVDEKEGEVENKVYYFHTDQIGTPLEMTDAEGQIVWQAKYRAWGAVEKLEVNEVEQNLRFQGQYFDAETGLHYNTFRYYDPEIGRFITQDPIGLLGGDNLYQYAPNTQSWIDALGLACDKWTVSSHKVNKSSVKGKNLGLDSHHVGQKDLMKDLVEGYDPATAPAMLVPRVGHTVSKEGVGIVSRSRINPNTGLPFTSARDVVARDIKELRRVYPDIPNTKLQELIKLNKSMYPEMR